MYYSAFDLDTGRYMETGLNSTSEHELVQAIFDWLAVGMEDDDQTIAENWTIDRKKEYVCGLANFRLDRHRQKI